MRILTEFWHNHRDTSWTVRYKSVEKSKNFAGNKRQTAILIWHSTTC